MSNRVKESFERYVDRHQEHLPLNVLGRVAMVGGFAGVVFKMTENAPAEAGTLPFVVAAAGCVMEIATQSAANK